MANQQFRILSPGVAWIFTYGDNMKRLIVAAIVLILALTGCVTVETDQVNPDVYETRVERVVDGDTIKAYVDGEMETIRFIGVNTPEIAHDDQEEEHYGDESTAFSEDMLKDQTIYLTKDVSDRDQYGRLLRFIWLEKPEDPSNYDEIEDKMFNAILLKEGYAHTVKFEPDVTFYKLFRNLQGQAEDAGKGMWAVEYEESERKDLGLIISDFDKKKEMVVIKNNSSEAIELEGYRLISVKDPDTQSFEFGPWLLEPLETVRVFSGPNFNDYSYDILWSEENMFSNSKLDPIALLDPKGNLIDQVDK